MHFGMSSRAIYRQQLQLPVTLIEPVPEMWGTGFTNQDSVASRWWHSFVRRGQGPPVFILWRSTVL